MSRKPIPKKLRFEVFKRDSFTCQYCGKSAPDVVLHVDHINPVSNCGTNNIMNLITSCIDCNLGKGAKKLDDNSVLHKQKKQLADLSERREQLKLMVKWQQESLKMEDTLVNSIGLVVFSGTNRHFTEFGKNEMRKKIKKYGYENVYSAAVESRSKYFNPDSEETTTVVIEKIGKICSWRELESKSPDTAKLLYIRGIVRNSMYCNESQCITLLKQAHQLGASIEFLTDHAKNSRNWSCWRDGMIEFIDANTPF